MLANLRTWGWCFNPIVIFWCFDTYGRPVAQVLGVTNTPWHEYHNYVLDLRGEPATSTLRKVHYHGNHLNYWLDANVGRPAYPRALLRPALNQALKHAGIVFPSPDAPPKVPAVRAVA